MVYSIVPTVRARFVWLVNSFRPILGTVHVPGSTLLLLLQAGSHGHFDRQDVLDRVGESGHGWGRRVEWIRLVVVC